MESYAVIETGGKQYRVTESDTLRVEKLEGDAGDSIVINKVLAVSDGKAITVGTPEISGAKVSAKIVEQIKAAKVVNFKKKRRKGYSRKVGHRQQLSIIKIDKIEQ
ncbi:MAG: 50S ribosomal protein L21 [Kiritimatiellae bacterium]|nr:50S ribosomal protein L21 [Kiritimatiellia bacterium]